MYACVCMCTMCVSEEVGEERRGKVSSTGLPVSGRAKAAATMRGVGGGASERVHRELRLPRRQLRHHAQVVPSSGRAGQGVPQQPQLIMGTWHPVAAHTSRRDVPWHELSASIATRGEAAHAPGAGAARPGSHWRCVPNPAEL